MMKLSTLLLALLSLLALMLAGCSEKPQEEPTPAAATGAAAPAPGDAGSSAVAPKDGDLQRFKRP